MGRDEGRRHEQQHPSARLEGRRTILCLGVFVPSPHQSTNFTASGGLGGKAAGVHRGCKPKEMLSDEQPCSYVSCRSERHGIEKRLFALCC